MKRSIENKPELADELKLKIEELLDLTGFSPEAKRLAEERIMSFLEDACSQASSASGVEFFGKTTNESKWSTGGIV